MADASGSSPVACSSSRAQRSSSPAGTVAPSGVARGLPEVDAGLDGVAVDLGQLLVGELEVAERAEAVLELLDAYGRR